MPGRREFLRSLAVAPFVLGPASATEAVTIAPYLQRVDENQATMLWTTLEPGSGQVEWSADGKAWSTVASQAVEFASKDTGLGYSFYQHKADLTDLPTGSAVQYRVRWNQTARCNGVLRTSNRLRTLDTFVAFGDSGEVTPEQSQLMALMFADEPSLTLHTGDLAYPVASYDILQQKYLAPYSGLMAKSPFFPCPGNHDYGYESARAYIDTHSFPVDTAIQGSDKGRYYAFRWGPIRFISLDSNDPLVPEAPDNAMLGWLRDELSRNKAFWQVVLFHHPPYSAGYHKDDPYCALARERLAPMLEAAAIPLVLNGHDHLYARSVPVRGGRSAEEGHGTVYVTTGGGGANLYSYTPHELGTVGMSMHHYVRFKLDGYQLSGEAVGLDGTVLDRFRIAPAPSINENSPVNSATFQKGVAAGGLMTLFGRHLGLKEARPSVLPVPASGDGPLTVRLNGQPLPLLFSSPTQLNVQLPFNVEGRQMLRISTPNGACDVRVDVARAAPAVFQVKADRTLIPAVFAADSGLPVTGERPAKPGDIVSIYATGLGAVDAAVQPGEAPAEAIGPRTLADVRVRMDGRDVEPSYAGLATGLPGVYRITVKIPDDCPSGDLDCYLVVDSEVSDLLHLPIL